MFLQSKAHDHYQRPQYERSQVQSFSSYHERIDNISDKHLCTMVVKYCKASFKAAATPVHTIQEPINRFCILQYVKKKST